MVSLTRSILFAVKLELAELSTKTASEGLSDPKEDLSLLCVEGRLFKARALVDQLDSSPEGSATHSYYLSTYASRVNQTWRGLGRILESLEEQRKVNTADRRASLSVLVRGGAAAQNSFNNEEFRSGGGRVAMQQSRAAKNNGKGLNNIMLSLIAQGPSCSQTASRFKAALGDGNMRKLGSRDAAQVLSAISLSISGAVKEESQLRLPTQCSMKDIFSSLEEKDKGGISTLGQWNHDVIRSVIQQVSPNGGFDWASITASLDLDSFVVPSIASFDALSKLFLLCSDNTSAVNEGALFANGLWKNRPAQLALIACCIHSPHYSKELKSPSLRYFEPAKQNVKLDSRFAYLSWFSCIDAVETLTQLALSDGHTSSNNVEACTLMEEVLALVHYSYKQRCPENFLFTFSAVSLRLVTHMKDLAFDSLTSFRNSVAAKFLSPSLLALHGAGSQLLAYLVEFDIDLLVRAMITLHFADAWNTSTLLDIIQELKILPEVLEALDHSQPDAFPLSIDIACLASRRDFLNLEKWLKDQLQKHQAQFAIHCCRFLRFKMISKMSGTVDEQGSPENHFLNIGMATAKIFFKTLIDAGSASLPPEIIEDIYSLYQIVSSTTPKFAIFGDVHDSNEKFSSEIEDNANHIFQRIYVGQQSIPEVVEILKGLKHSKFRIQQDILVCMVHNLFDEYRFFPKYPDKELKITAYLFGSLVQHELISDRDLETALMCVLGALRTSPNSKMFSFGIIALEQFKARLVEWPQYCVNLLQIPGFAESVPDVAEYLEWACSQRPLSQKMPSSSQPGQVNSGLTQSNRATSLRDSQRQGANDALFVGTAASYGNPVISGEGQHLDSRTSTNDELAPIYRLGLASLSSAGLNSNSVFQMFRDGGGDLNANNSLIPQESLQDHCHFIFNNLTAQNLKEKSRELELSMNERFLPWLAFYVVTKRAAQEGNFHHLYIGVVEHCSNKWPVLLHMVIAATYDQVMVLLTVNDVRNNSSDRNLLKNIGSWLGLLTVSRNTPLLHLDIDVQSLISEAYINGRLIALVPFVSKILENCKHSKIFKPPNPWIMSIMSIISDIYHMPGVKLNIKFEIEMLCKTLDMDVEDIPRSQLLSSMNVDLKHSPDFSIKAANHEVTGASRIDEHTPSFPAMHGEFGRQHLATEVYGGPQAPLSQYSRTPNPESGAPAGHLSKPGQDDSSLQEFVSLVQVNPAIGMAEQQAEIKQLIALSLDYAVREIIQPVVERSVTISCITTRELILKDLALEPDDTNLRKAAHLMVLSLSGSLSLVTCKEPLRLGFSNHLRSMLRFLNAEPHVLEQAIQIATAENLGFGCSYIERVVSERALRRIDEAMASDFVTRQQTRDISRPVRQDDHALPDILQARAGPLAPHQRRLYEDFGRVPRAANATPQVSSIQDASSQSTGGSDGRGIGVNFTEQSERRRQQGKGSETSADQERGMRSSADGVQTAKAKVLGTQELLERYFAIRSFLDQAIRQLSSSESLPSNDVHFAATVSRSFTDIQDLISFSNSKDEACSAIAQHEYRRLLSCRNEPMIFDSYVSILGKLRGIYPKSTKDLTSWLSLTEKDVKANHDAILALARNRLVIIEDLDSLLSKGLDFGRNSHVLDLCIRIVVGCIINDKVVDGQELPTVLDALQRISQKGMGPKNLSEIIKEAKSVKKIAKAPSSQTIDIGVPLFSWVPTASVNDRSARMLESVNMWIRLCANSPNSIDEDGLSEFITGFTRYFVLENFAEIDSALYTAFQFVFVRDNAPNTVTLFRVDAFSRLLVFVFNYLLRFLSKSNTLALKFVEVVLKIAVQVLAVHHRNGFSSFAPKLHFRFHLNMVAQFLSAEPVLRVVSFEFVGLFSIFFRSIQPIVFPGYAFAWLELVAHKNVLSSMLSTRSTWTEYTRLLSDLLSFISTVSFKGDAWTEPLNVLQDGTVRLVLVIYREFPEYLREHASRFFEILPASCSKLRGIFQSACQ